MALPRTRSPAFGLSAAHLSSQRAPFGTTIDPRVGNVDIMRQQVTQSRQHGLVHAPRNTECEIQINSTAFCRIFKREVNEASGNDDDGGCIEREVNHDRRGQSTNKA